MPETVVIMVMLLAALQGCERRSDAGQPPPLVAATARIDDKRCRNDDAHYAGTETIRFLLTVKNDSDQPVSFVTLTVAGQRISTPISVAPHSTTSECDVLMSEPIVAAAPVVVEAVNDAKQREEFERRKRGQP